MRVWYTIIIALLDSFDIDWNKPALHEAWQFHHLVHSLSTLLAEMVRQPSDLGNVCLHVIKVLLANRSPSVAVPEDVCGIALGLVRACTVASVRCDSVGMLEAVRRSDTASPDSEHTPVRLMSKPTGLVQREHVMTLLVGKQQIRRRVNAAHLPRTTAHLHGRIEVDAGRNTSHIFSIWLGTVFALVAIDSSL